MLCCVIQFLSPKIGHFLNEEIRQTGRICQTWMVKIWISQIQAGRLSKFESDSQSNWGRRRRKKKKKKEEEKVLKVEKEKNKEKPKSHRTQGHSRWRSHVFVPHGGLQGLQLLLPNPKRDRQILADSSSSFLSFSFIQVKWIQWKLSLVFFPFHSFSFPILSFFLIFFQCLLPH